MKTYGGVDLKTVVFLTSAPELHVRATKTLRKEPSVVTGYEAGLTPDPVSILGRKTVASHGNRIPSLRGLKPKAHHYTN
jgi:hypothetical protein